METIIQEFKQGSKDFEQHLLVMDEDQFNTKPAAGSWSAGQVCQHVHKSDSAILKALYGPTEETDRDPGEKIKGLRAIFLNFSHKLKSPDFIVPDDRSFRKDELIHSFRLIRTKLTEAFETLDLSPTCLSLPPELGPMTRLEVLHFVTVHTIRHIHQLEKIKSLLSNANDAKPRF